MNDLIAGRFRLVGVLGEGAMGVVFRAYDEVLDRELALKEMRVPAGVDAGEALDRFVTEARAAARLADPSIVTVHDVVQDGDRVLIAMELLSGATLADVLASGSGGVAPDQVREVMGSVASALAVAHGQGVVHRDLKPDNVFWLESGRVVVTDFGLARIGAGRGTQLGTVMGTPGYMAPEQIRGDGVGAAADVFSWGAVAHELLTGVPVFGGPELEATALMWNVVHEPAPVLEIPSDPGLAGLVAWALAKDPGDRPEDGSALLSVLRGGGSVPPMTVPVPVVGSAAATPAAVVTPGGPRQGRSKGLVVGVVAAVLVVLAAAVGLVVALSGGDTPTAATTQVAVDGGSSEDTSATTSASTAPTASSTAPVVTSPPTTVGPPGLQQFDGRQFDLLYPSGWSIKRAEEPVQGAAYPLEDTTFVGDGRDLAIVRVNIGFPPDSDPMAAAGPVREQLQSRPTYVEIGFSPDVLSTASGTYEAVRWEYLLEHPDHPVLLHNVNYFLDVGGRSLALLTRAPVDDFDGMRSTFDDVRNSLFVG